MNPPFLHVLIKTRQSPEYFQILFVDLDGQSLEKQFLQSYRRSASLVVKGSILKFDDLVEIRIVQTARTFHDELEVHEKENNRWRNQSNISSQIMLMPFIIQDRDIAECGIEVTEQFFYLPFERLVHYV